MCGKFLGANVLKENCCDLNLSEGLCIFTLGVDKIRNMEHPGIFRNIPEHPGTSNNYDNYEKKGVKLNFGLADVTIWSAQIGQVT